MATSKPDDITEEHAPEHEHETERIRKLTEKATEEYNKCVDKYNDKLYQIKRNLDYEIYMCKMDEHPTSETIRLCEDRVKNALAQYAGLSEEFANFLQRKQTEQSLKELDSQRSGWINIENNATLFLKEFGHKRKLLEVKGALKSRSSATSRSGSKATSRSRSNKTSDTVKLKAKAEAAKAALEFAAKEAALKKADAEMSLKKMNLQTDLEFLSKQRDAAVATAEYTVFENSESQGLGSDPEINLPREGSMERTRHYVETQDNLQHTDNTHVMQSQHDTQDLRTRNNAWGVTFQTEPHVTLPTVNHYSGNMNGSIRHNQRSFTQPPNGPVASNLGGTMHRHEQDTTNNNTLSEWSRFLLKKDMLLSRFSRFNDRPESFSLWKSSFQAITRELMVTAIEEMELLVKWLGPESSKFTQSIRTANINNPNQGLQKIWKRLEDRYGQPEMVEMSMKAKLNDFLKVTLKDRKKLYDLQDILSEILALKENPKYEKLLSYFDTSVGVNPIVMKLQYNIQTKWRDRATSYKRSKGVAFPPFTFFVDFIGEIAGTFNDPGFNFDSDQNNNKFGDKTRFSHKPQVQVKKTAVINDNKDMPLKCAIHKTNHSLNECRTFRSKSKEERRKLLKDNGICFRCLESKDHMSRNCTKTVSCQECNSTRHCTAMHISESEKTTEFQPAGNTTYLQSAWRGATSRK